MVFRVQKKRFIIITLSLRQKYFVSQKWLRFGSFCDSFGDGPAYSFHEQRTKLNQGEGHISAVPDELADDVMKTIT